MTPPPPIIVRLIQPESNAAMDFADVLIRSLGLSAVLGIAAALLGLLAGGLLIGVRFWRGRQSRPSDQSDFRRVTPGA